MLSRRVFLEKTLAGASALILPFSASLEVDTAEITFGIMADPHKDLLHDVDDRLETFLMAIENKSTDFIVQLGDFCFPKSENRTFLGLWNSYEGPKYHVLGNHDMDVSSKKETMDFWQMPSNYYSFDQQGFHFVVLDANFLNYSGNYQDYDTANFYVDNPLRTWINPEQIEWLKTDLKKSILPTIVFSHQSLVNDLWGIKNRGIVQQVLEEANDRAGFQKILACFNGHNHIDAIRRINDIYYIDINSMSYQWLGEKYQTKVRYPVEVYERYPNIINMATYRDSLFAMIKITKDSLEVIGVESSYVGPSPAELGLTDQVYGYAFTPNVSSRNLALRSQ